MLLGTALGTYVSEDEEPKKLGKIVANPATALLGPMMSRFAEFLESKAQTQRTP